MQSTLDLRVLWLFSEDRVRQLRRTPLQLHSNPTRRPLRRWVGRRMVHFGMRLAGEPTMRPVRSQ